MTVGSIIEGAFRLIRERPGAVLIWIMIMLGAGIASSFVMVWIINGQLEALFAGASQTSVEWGYLWRSLLLGLVNLMVATILYAAVQRAILRPGEGGPGSLRLGMDELRLFLLAFLYLVVFIIALVVIAFVFALFMAGAGPGSAGTSTIVFGAVALVLAAYFGTRLSLTFPATLIHGRYALGEGWSLTNGRFWTLFGAYFIIFLILVATGVACMFVTDREYLSAIVQYGFNSAEVQQAALREYQLLMTGEINLEVILKWVLAAVQGGLGVALAGGAAATAARDLTTDEQGLSDTFA